VGPAAGKYARFELERRFLCSRVPESVSDDDGWDIVDRYLPASRLRLRRMDALDGSETVFKLGKKEVPEPPDFARMTITNIYLSEAEYALLSELPALELRKRRYRVAERGRTYGVDVFEGSLAGLVLAETGFDPEAEEELELPDWIERDVSQEERFTGGSLARQASSAPSS
jgi:CYTH domain-containing protein